MATIDINGTLVDFPDDMPPDQLRQAVAAAAKQIGGQQEKPGLMRKAWDALAIPEQKSREGLKMIAEGTPRFSGQLAGEMAGGLVPGGQGFGREIGGRFPTSDEPSGNLMQDMVTGAPRVGADTLADFAPGFVSRGSLVTSGLGKALGTAAPAAKAVLRGLGKQGESLSGSVPGSLEAAYNDSSLMFGKGRKAASEAYEVAKAGEKIQYGDKLTSAKKFFDQAYAKAKAGVLGGTEALEARKIADDLYDSGQYVPDEILSKRKVFDEIAKKTFASADAGYKQALQSESLRNILPQNKYGGTSAFKIAVMTALKKMGPVGTAASTALSPIVQGLAATGAGAATRQVLAPLAADAGTGAAAYAVLADILRRRSANAKK